MLYCSGTKEQEANTQVRCIALSAPWGLCFLMNSHNLTQRMFSSPYSALSYNEKSQGVPKARFSCYGLLISFPLPNSLCKGEDALSKLLQHLKNALLNPSKARSFFCSLSNHSQQMNQTVLPQVPLPPKHWISPNIAKKAKPKHYEVFTPASATILGRGTSTQEALLPLSCPPSWD